MLETYLAFFVEHWIAAVAFVLQLAIRPVVRYLGLRPDQEDLRPWVRRYRDLPELLKGMIDGLLLSVSSLMFEWYILTIVLPRLRGGVVSAIGGFFMLLVGAGIGLSMGKALTESEYSWYKHE